MCLELSTSNDTGKGSSGAEEGKAAEQGCNYVTIARHWSQFSLMTKARMINAKKKEKSNTRRKTRGRAHKA